MEIGGKLTEPYKQATPIRYSCLIKEGWDTNLPGVSAKVATPGGILNKLNMSVKRLTKVLNKSLGATTGWRAREGIRVQ